MSVRVCICIFMYACTHGYMYNCIIFPGVLADQEVRGDLLSAKDRGEADLQAFVHQMINTGSVDIFAKIPQNILKTFQDILCLSTFVFIC